MIQGVAESCWEEGHIAKWVDLGSVGGCAGGDWVIDRAPDSSSI